MVETQTNILKFYYGLPKLVFCTLYPKTKQLSEKLLWQLSKIEIIMKIFYSKHIVHKNLFLEIRTACDARCEHILLFSSCMITLQLILSEKLFLSSVTFCSRLTCLPLTTPVPQIKMDLKGDHFAAMTRYKKP